MFESIPYTDFHSSQHILIDYLGGKKASGLLLPRHYSESGAFENLADLLDRRNYNRDLLHQVLTELNRIYEAGDATFSNINKLQEPGTLVVIGGQQTGLFGGPLYTLYKAITVIKLAGHLSTTLKRSVVPVFWMASDDHDFAEVNHVFVPDLSGQIRKISDENDDTDERIPLSMRKVSKEITALVEDLADCMPESEFRPDIISNLKKAYTPGQSYPQCFGAWLLHILGQYGIIVVDPSDARLKQQLVPLMRREIVEESPISKAISTQTNKLIENGYRAQLQLQDGLLNIFYHRPERESISFRNGKFTLKSSNTELTKAEILSELEGRPENFSPNAAFRPLMQDALFPTLAMVLGPSEIAYWVQLRMAYEALGLEMPIAFPRVSATLLEPRALRILHKYELSTRDVVMKKGRIIDALAARDIPKGLFSAIESGENEVARIWTGLLEAVSQFDMNLQKPAEIAKGRSVSQFEFLNKKLIQAAKQKDEVLRSQVQKILNLIYPMSSPQERIFNMLPFYVRFGEKFIDTVYSQVDIFNPDHQVITLD